MMKWDGIEFNEREWKCIKYNELEYIEVEWNRMKESQRQNKMEWV